MAKLLMKDLKGWSRVGGGQFGSGAVGIRDICSCVLSPDLDIAWTTEIESKKSYYG